MIGIDVLADERDLADARAREMGDLAEDCGDRARGLGAAGVRHDAKRAELVAALLHGDEGGGAATANRVDRRRRKPRKLVLGRKVGLHDSRTQARFVQQFGQAMIALRADDDIDRGLAAQDFRPLRLGDAAGDHQRRPPAGPGAFLLELAQLAELGKDLLGGAFADVAGVENDEVGVLGAGGLAVSRACGEIPHPLGIIDVHLASERLDEHPWARFPRGMSGPVGIFKHSRFGQSGAPKGSTR